MALKSVLVITFHFAPFFKRKFIFYYGEPYSHHHSIIYITKIVETEYKFILVMRHGTAIGFQV